MLLLFLCVCVCSLLYGKTTYPIKKKEVSSCSHIFYLIIPSHLSSLGVHALLVDRVLLLSDS